MVATKRTSSGSTPSKRAPKSAQIERTIKAVLDATTELLVEIGYRSTTVEKISERSGVARSTIYRHWSGVPEVAIDAFDAALGPVADTPDLGDVRTNLVFHYERFADSLKHGIRGKLMPSLLEAAQNDKGFDALFESLVDRRSDSTREILRRAIESGEVQSDTKIEWVIDLLGGLLHHRLLITGTNLKDSNLIEWAVDSALSQVLKPKTKARKKS